MPVTQLNRLLQCSDGTGTVILPMGCLGSIQSRFQCFKLWGGFWSVHFNFSLVFGG